MYLGCLFALHCLGVFLIWNVSGFVLPSCVLRGLDLFVNFTLFCIAAYWTFGITKKKFLNDKISPVNKAVWVTGCSTGFGHELVCRLDSLGFHVFATSRDPSSDGVTRLKERCSPRLRVVQLDIRREVDVQKAVQYLKENLGSCELWCVVNNAGVYRSGSFELTKMDVFQDLLEVNVLGHVRVTKALMPLLRRSRGRVVNVTSPLGKSATPHFSPYTISKYAMEGFHQSLQEELDEWGLSVVAVEPELFRTGLITSENMNSNFESLLENLDEELRELYGDEFLMSYKNFVKFINDNASDKLDLVMDALESAIVLQNPDPLYRVMRNKLVAFFYFGLDYVPFRMKIFLSRMLLSYIGIPKPKGTPKN